jgi:hypothetical protein
MARSVMHCFPARLTRVASFLSYLPAACCLLPAACCLMPAASVCRTRSRSLTLLASQS